MADEHAPNAEAAYLLTLAHRVVDAAVAESEVEAALLAGSAGRGLADRFSDLDLLFYVSRVPSDEQVDDVRRAVGGTDPLRHWEATGYANGEEFRLHGVRTEISFTLVERVEWQLDDLLRGLNDVASPKQKFLAGLADGLPLYGDVLIERWKSRLREFPEPFRRAMIEQHWNVFPLWHYSEAMALRDAELWRLDVLLESAFNLLGVLAALNRLYFARFELKRMRDFIGRMSVTPPDLADRVEALFHLPAAEAASALGALADETRVLVRAELPDLALDLPRPLGSRQQRWSFAK